MDSKPPKSLRLQIGIFGRTNVGKSNFINALTSQDVSITSPYPGTTTDIVEKAAEFRPSGPVLLIDTAGIDDASPLSENRIKRTAAVFERADVFVVVAESGIWGNFEKKLCREAKLRDVPVIIVVNKIDLCEATDDFRRQLKESSPYIMECSCADRGSREAAAGVFGNILAKCAPEGSLLTPPSIAADLLPAGGLALLVTPIDSGAPKGRLIMPQVQTIRDILDERCAALIVKDSEYVSALSMLRKNPDIVICDSQVVKKIDALTPSCIPLTTFSILFARLKGDVETLAQGAAAIDTLKSGDKILISEACTHHAAGDDIGRVKIPYMLRERTGLQDNLQIDTCCGRDYPANLEQYSLVIHCGACMLTGREMASRIKEAKNKNVPITNYGMAISYFCGVLDRTIKPLTVC